MVQLHTHLLKPSTDAADPLDDCFDVSPVLGRPLGRLVWALVALRVAPTLGRLVGLVVPALVLWPFALVAKLIFLQRLACRDVWVVAV